MTETQTLQLFIEDVKNFVVLLLWLWLCAICRTEATSKEEVKDGDPTIASTYVGETSKTIQERLRKHWSWRRESKRGVAHIQAPGNVPQWPGGQWSSIGQPWPDRQVRG